MSCTCAEHDLLFFTGKEKSNHGSSISDVIPKGCKSGKANENRQVSTRFI